MNNKQTEAFEKFKKLKVGALFMQMGSGKTKVALDLVKYNKVDLLVYITPYSTKSNIQDEILKWGVDCDYKIVGYETIQSSVKKYLELLRYMDNKKCFIVADESIFIKNEETKRFQRICEIRNKCEYALILNGTPLTKNEWDLYNQMYFLSPKIFNMNRTDFLSTFFKKITYKKRNSPENTFYVFSEINAEQLKKMIEPYMFQCDLDFDKSEETNYMYVKYECLDEEDSYNDAKRELLELYKKTENSDVIINLLTRLNVISSNYEAKNKRVADYINNRQVICYCNYLSEVEYISNQIECYVITGSTKNRGEIIQQFRNDNKPLIMTYGVGSYSLNLQFCNEIVYTSLNYDYAKYEQSKYRIKRIGQKNNIKYTYILTELGINRIILENLDKKMTLKELVNQKLKEGNDEQWIKSL